MHTTAQINIPRAMMQMRSVIGNLLSVLLHGKLFRLLTQVLLNDTKVAVLAFRFLGLNVRFDWFGEIRFNVLRFVAHCRIVLTGSRWVEGS